MDKEEMRKEMEKLVLAKVLEEKRILKDKMLKERKNLVN